MCREAEVVEMSSELDPEKRKRALDKIKKCFALAKSSNAHEADAAMRQAQKLMDKFKFELGDVHASRAEEFTLKVGKGKSMPARWVRMLAATVAKAFGCINLYGYGRSGQTLTFIGDTGTAEMAAYAYEVLARQLTDSRRNYLSGLQFASPSNKRRAGDLYAESWITSVARRVEEFAGVSEEVERAISAYMSKHHPDVPVGNMKRRKVSPQEYGAYQQGLEDGAGVSLHTPMGHDQMAQIAQQANGG